MASDVGTEKVRSANCWISWFKRVDSLCRQVRINVDLRRDVELSFYLTKRLIPGFQEKPLSVIKLYLTVPQTDTGGQEENSKALERNQEKELGKLIP